MEKFPPLIIIFVILCFDIFIVAICHKNCFIRLVPRSENFSSRLSSSIVPRLASQKVNSANRNFFFCWDHRFLDKQERFLCSVEIYMQKEKNRRKDC